MCEKKSYWQTEISTWRKRETERMIKEEIGREKEAEIELELERKKKRDRLRCR